MFSIYTLKPAFQRALIPLVRRLGAAGVSANAVTVTAALVSLALGATLYAQPERPALFLLLPLWMLLRMACNAIDGLLAQHFGQQSRLGAILNELADVVSDAALYLPFAVVAPFGWPSVGAIVFLSALAEMAGVLSAAVGSGRANEGPMGKSDRALVFGALGLWYGATGAFPEWAFWVMPVTAGAIILTLVNRVRHALA